MELKSKFVIRNPAFLFFLVVAMFVMFQIGVWIGRSWPDFPCPKQHRYHENNIDAEVSTSSGSNAVPTSVRPIGKPTAFDKDMIDNKDIVFDPPSSEYVLKTKLAALKKGAMQKKGDSNSSKPLQKQTKVDKDMVILPNKVKDRDILHRTIPDYVQIREADSPQTGDFNCGGSVIPHCCAFYVDGIEEAKKVCDSYSDYCKGFVLSVLNASPTNVQHLMYLKREVNQMSLNFLTDFFVKSKHMNKISWKNAN